MLIITSKIVSFRAKTSIRNKSRYHRMIKAQPTQHHPAILSLCVAYSKVSNYMKAKQVEMKEKHHTGTGISRPSSWRLLELLERTPSRLQRDPRRHGPLGLPDITQPSTHQRQDAQPAQVSWATHWESRVLSRTTNLNQSKRTLNHPEYVVYAPRS